MFEDALPCHDYNDMGDGPEGCWQYVHIQIQYNKENTTKSGKYSPMFITRTKV